MLPLKRLAHEIILWAFRTKEICRELSEHTFQELTEKKCNCLLTVFYLMLPIMLCVSLTLMTTPYIPYLMLIALFMTMGHKTYEYIQIESLLEHNPF